MKYEVGQKLKIVKVSKPEHEEWIGVEIEVCEVQPESEHPYRFRHPKIDGFWGTAGAMESELRPLTTKIRWI